MIAWAPAATKADVDVVITFWNFLSKVTLLQGWNAIAKAV